MRLRSASNRERSKYALRPHGIFELSRVASAVLRRPASTALTPLNLRLCTLIVPSSLHAEAAIANTTSVERRTETRMATAFVTTTRATASVLGAGDLRLGLGARRSVGLRRSQP